MSHVTHIKKTCRVGQIDEACHTCESGMSHNKNTHPMPCRTNQRGMSHIWMRHVTQQKYTPNAADRGHDDKAITYDRSLLQKSPIKETTFCKSPMTHTHGTPRCNTPYHTHGKTNCNTPCNLIYTPNRWTWSQQWGLWTNTNSGKPLLSAVGCVYEVHTQLLLVINE